MLDIALEIHMPQDVFDRLAFEARCNHHSLNAEALTLIKNGLEPDPLLITLRKVVTPDETFLTVAYDDVTVDDFAEVDTEAEAAKAVFDKIKELGEVPVKYIDEIIS